jgi:hypothetical protein
MMPYAVEALKRALNHDFLEMPYVKCETFYRSIHLQPAQKAPKRVIFNLCKNEMRMNMSLEHYW